MIRWAWLLVLGLFLVGTEATHAQHVKYKKKKHAVKHSSKSRRKNSKKYILPKPIPVPSFNFSTLNDPNNPLEQIFKADSIFYGPFLAKKDQRRIQIIYTQIDRDSLNHPHFRDYSFNVNGQMYFYPASCVKLPLSALTLEKLNEWFIPGLSRETPLVVDSVNTCQYPTIWDSTCVSSGYRATLGHYIKKILLVSDNDAYNRMYEFNGTERIHRRLSGLGLPEVRVTHRFFNCDSNANRVTNRFRFLDPCGEVFYTQETLFDSNVYSCPAGTVCVGKAYMDFDNLLKPWPKNFTGRNYFKLHDIHSVLQRIIFPESFPVSYRFNMSEDDYAFMRKYMSMYATESIEPRYDSAHGYFDAIKKYLIYGQKRDTMVDKELRIFNIVGFSYGFLVDVAYVIDFKTGAEFMLAATIYSNESEILNWNKYEYYTVGMPFMKKLGLDFLLYEQLRERKHKADFSKFRFDYK